MMHRYLFRAMRDDGKGWLEGFLFANKHGKHYILPYEYYGSTSLTSCMYVDPATVGQCTGLKDKHGKLIFEGDIAKGFYEETDGRIVDYFEEVKYITDQGGWVLGDEDAFNNLDGISAQEVEVVGNAHDNPELLEGGGERWIKS